MWLGASGKVALVRPGGAVHAYPITATTPPTTTTSAGRTPHRAVRHIDGGDPVRQHDREEDQHQDAADVDQQLRRGDEVGGEEHVHRRHNRRVFP